MSEGDVSLIRDEDVLRRMWQQTEDFGRKKEIRAHMYKLREERLRDLYSPEPTLGKGGDHMASFADQSFQRIKGKEVRDAASPTKDFGDRQQDLKELSNAGWNVHSENRTTDGGHTHIEALKADIQGHYDVEGGKGHFAAVDEQTRAKTEYKDDHKHIKKQDNLSKSHAHEQVHSKTDDGTQMTSTTSSSSTQYRQVSSVEESIPFETVNKRSESRNIERSELESQKDQQTQKTVHKKGELISRTVDHPDENTTVIVETRVLPDGTKCISTQKHFSGHDTSRSERQSQSKSESKSYSTKQRTDMQTSHIIKEDNYDNHRDIVDSQRSVDDNDFNKNQQTIRRRINEHNIDDTDYDVKTVKSYGVSKQRNVENSSTKISNQSTQKYTTECQNVRDLDIDLGINQHVIEHHVNECENLDQTNQRDRTTAQQKRTYQNFSTESQNVRDNSDIRRNQHVVEHHVNPCENVDKTDRYDRTASQQNRTIQNTVEETFIKDENQKNITNERVEKTSSDQYQTTYQNDYTQKKISNDWSASHQAWASTLRGDTPSATRPSTRASSPGSRTFQSSTSSLRSSVSPDKTYRQPSSRGSSPSKQDRSSPSRSDKYSFTHSTQSISENRTNQTRTTKNSSPERKPPSGRFQPGPESIHKHQRSSASPEKHPENKNNRALSPEKQPQTYRHRSNVSPDKRSEIYRQRPSVSPEKRPQDIGQKPSDMWRDDLNISPIRKTTRSSTSPEKSTKRSSERSPAKAAQIIDGSPNKSDKNPESTVKSHLSDLRRPSVSPDIKSEPMLPTASHAPKHATSNVTTCTSFREDNFKSTEEKSKLHSHTVKDETKFNTFTRSSKSPSPIRKEPIKETSPIKRSETPTKPTLRQGSRSPSPPKGPVTFTSDTYKTNTVKSNKVDSANNVEFDKHTTKSIIKEKSPDKIPISKHGNNPSRESSYTTYDKTYNLEKNENITSTSKETTEHIDTLKRTDNSKTASMKSKNKTHSRDNNSPSKDAKYKRTIDFISTERQTEEFNKTVTGKDRPRQLVTPSTSPSRKPKAEREPSTGQSSPTSSVSGFEYYSGKVPVTDLDDQETYYETILSEHTNITNSAEFNKSESVIVGPPTPSKIPCRSPSPEKRASPIKEALPRKSSLKKPSVDLSTMSPIERPPASFQISHKVESKDNLEHKVVKKERTDNPEIESVVKVKPPFERRETYEERCRKILGMIDDKSMTNTENSSTTFTSTTNVSSPSVSTCSTPTLRGESPNEFNKPISVKSSNDITDFIAHEKEDSHKTSQINKVADKSLKVKNPSRDSSPTKLKDIFTDKISSVHETDVSFLNRKSESKTASSLAESTGTTGKTRQSPSPQRPSSRSGSPKKDSDITKSNISCVEIDVTDSNKNTITEKHYSSNRPSSSPNLRTSNDKISSKSSIPVKQSEEIKSRTPSPSKKVPEKLRVSSPAKERTPSPTKNITTETDRARSIHDSNNLLISSQKNTTIESSDFIITEREQQALEKVQKSLRKLSPQRSERKSPSREKSPNKSTISLQDLDEFEVIISNVQTDAAKRPDQKSTSTLTNKKTEQKNSKPISRNISPVKRLSPASPPKVEKKIDNSTKSRSISPKKALSSPIERPQSPQVPKLSGIRPREPTPKKTAPRNISPSKLDKTTTVDKKSPVNKQNSFTTSPVTKSTTTKITTTSTKTDLDAKRSNATVTNKGINKENVSPKREPERVTRTTSDTSMRLKKPSPQRVKSKPEIQVNDTPKTSPVLIKQQKPKESPSKLAPKPKSATALNTPQDDDDIIVDVELAKSSRENSPDRICPTPVGFMDDVGTPRLPDEVNEPDDDFKKRTHHVIHETESIVDDIVEISEEEELFVKRPEQISESDECLLSVTDKVSKFTDKITSVGKPKQTTSTFKDTEIREHSDHIDENLKSDECLLSVSQKVNKFAKGQAENKDANNSSRKIVDEYDINTVYQDDYTKLSVNDKAHLFIETAENSKTTKTKPSQKAQRPDLTDVDESLKSDDCLLSVSDKVNKFVKTAEQFLTEARIDEEKEKKIREQHDFIMRQIVNSEKDKSFKETVENTAKTVDTERAADHEDYNVLTKDASYLLTKSKEHSSPNLKPTDRPAPVKITTLRSSEAVKKAKALFENIASTTQTAKETTTTKLTDIGVIRKSSSKDFTNCQESNIEQISKIECEADGKAHVDSPARLIPDKKSSGTPTRLTAPLSDNTRQKSPLRQTIDTPRNDRRSVSPRPPMESTKDKENIPGYQRPTKTSQLKEETKVTEDYEVSTRRGSGKFGVELRRASADKPAFERGPSSELPGGERRRSSDHHQPCIEDIYDVALLEQMLEKVVGYEQRRRIRAQIRIAKKKTEDNENTNTYTKTTRTLTSSKTVNVDRQRTKSPDHQRASYAQRVPSTEPHVPKINTIKTASPDRAPLKDQGLPVNGHSKLANGKIPRSPSPEKYNKAKTRSPTRQPSPDKRIRPQSPTKTASPAKPKSNRFSEYASAYIKKVGLNEKEAIKSDVKNSKLTQEAKITTETQNVETVQVKEHKAIETKLSSSTITRSITERNASRDKIEILQLNGKRSPSPEKKKSPERRAPSPLKSKARSPSPIKREKLETIVKKESLVNTDIGKKVQTKPIQEEKPSWVTNRNLKKITSDTRTFSAKKIEPEKPKYRALSPSKAIVKPIDVITSSYGPGPLDADGKPLFGIKALRNGSSNYQVKGTVIRQEYRSHNGSAPEGSISVTAYSSQPEPLEQLLETQGQPRFLQGLAAITTTKKFGGSTGTSITEAYTKEERAALDQFTRSDLRQTDSKLSTSTRTEGRSNRLANQGVTITEVTDKETRKTDKQSNVNKRSSVERTEERTGSTTRKQERRGETTEKRGERMVRGDDKKTVRQSSVKSLTEKYIKSTNETSKSDRSAYPKAGLILRAGAGRRDSPAGLPRAGSAHSLASEEEHTSHCTVTDTQQETSRTYTQETKGETVTSSSRRSERSFLDSTTKVTGVQDILTRMKNADIVIEAGDSSEDAEARALLNKFLGATVLMAGMQSYVTDAGSTGSTTQVKQESVQKTSNKVISPSIEDIDLDQCWDERLLRTFLERCQDYEQRRRIRARLRSLMAEQEACAQAVTAALGAAGDACDEREEAAEVTSVSASVRRGSSESSVVTTTTSTTTRSSKVIESMTRPAPKQVSPFAKFRQLEKQNSTDSSNGRVAAPLFRITDPALQASALTIKERLLQWCRDKTRDYENVKLENFSTSWADGLAFCALVHHFLPDAFDYSALTPDQRRHNFTLAFKVADEKAGIYPLLDVEDMVTMRRPDWKCVFTYVQAIHRRFRDER